MRKVLIIASLLGGCALSGCATQQAAPGDQPSAAHDPAGPPYPYLTPPWLNPGVGTMNTSTPAPTAP
jgi:hypothetical protein